MGVTLAEAVSVGSTHPISSLATMRVRFVAAERQSFAGLMHAAHQHCESRVLIACGPSFAARSRSFILLFCASN